MLNCPVGCTQLGNCNHEMGNCECPWPRRGPTCEEDPLSLCYDDPTNHTVPSCGIRAPKNCECYKQCQNLHCQDSNGDVYNCEHELGRKIGEARCFLYRNRPVDQQGSAIPKKGKEVVDWYRIPAQGWYVWKSGKPRWWWDWLPFKQRWALRGSYEEFVIPLEDCPLNCTSRGVCIQEITQIKCICRKGFKGLACELDDNEEACWFSPTCNGHGKCKSGFCHCDPGWWGLGCTRSSAYALESGSKAVPSRLRLRIYMYDIPSEHTFPGEYDDGVYTRDNMYAAYEYFIKYFLQDWDVRTENPNEANMFFVPALVYFYAGNLGNPLPHLRKVVKYISTTYPFWNRTGGKDHFWWMTGDQGACWMPEDLMRNPIKLVHFGLTGSNLTWRDPPRDLHLDKEYGCILPERDIVTPPVVHNKFPNTGKSIDLFKTILENRGSDARLRKLLLFFAGAFQMTDMMYSGGARQGLNTTFQNHNPSDVLMMQGTTYRYDDLFLDSKFCVAPYGFGWGLRLSIAVTHACIPVIIQDHVHQPFEDILPYQQFSVRLRVKDVPSIVSILRSYSDEQLAVMRYELGKHWAAFLWPREAGGLAYNYTIKALRKRMYNYAAEYYRL
ncbi:hypothetical protein CEUSTIGMA_g13705.t1 [Chlamydomonas eustigma]|uniref:EGF-like domain-containing protein n=1 Tax=Chlamydomonas eustigma TaxID=1157962 RepID=A0A250XTF7_9CHLO|nr:hypothetical protein CEUSTIGMA_g13705.t1 [Chlamydomonas eustigma]|eukprot:GAX86293.1 hypothetical protein CEUSTIGMA_g13705.t1 [Chlamydomonas eustigma]